MKVLHRSIIGIHLFVGLGALAGGWAAVSNPASPLGISVDMLKNGPFRDYLIPGLVLMIVIGAGNLMAALLTTRRAKYHGLSSCAMGIVLMGWIVVQCYILQTVAVLHAVFFLIGAVQGLAAFAILYQQDMFPASLVRKWFKLN